MKKYPTFSALRLPQMCEDAEKIFNVTLRVLSI
jgi:hypothetical protein